MIGTRVEHENIRYMYINRTDKPVRLYSQSQKVKIFYLGPPPPLNLFTKSTILYMAMNMFVIAK